jgi:hypothetical protein
MKKLLLAVALFVCVAVPGCFGQASAINGQIEGTVTDPTGAVMPGATVTIENVNTGLKRELTTDSSGFFRFTVLPIGTYALKVTSTGFLAQTRTGIVLDAGSTATVDLSLQVGGTATTVEVSGAAPVIEPGRTDLGSMLSTNSIENLPLLSRNPYNFILLQPNASARPNTEFGVPRKINANGFTDRINFELDGSNNTQSDRAGIRLLPISNTFIAEVQQVNNGFAPEFGNTTGTVFNAITKSGTNDVHGEAAYIFRRPSFNARPTLLAPTAPTPDLSLDSYFADAGGRVIKDKLFWFGAFEHDQRGLPSAVSVTPDTLTQIGLPTSYSNAIPFSQSVYFYMGKADWQINQNNRLSGRFNYFRNESPFNNGGGQTLITQTYLFKDRAPVGAVQLISTLSPSMVNEFRFAIPKRYQRQVAFDGTGGRVWWKGTAAGHHYCRCGQLQRLGPDRRGVHRKDAAMVGQPQLHTRHAHLQSRRGPALRPGQPDQQPVRQVHLWQHCRLSGRQERDQSEIVQHLPADLRQSSGSLQLSVHGHVRSRRLEGAAPSHHYLWPPLRHLQDPHR